jgi:DNA mismatch repair protein MutS
MIYDDYMQYCIEYVKEYGENTVVLMEIGGFYELYAVNHNGEKSGADIYDTASILGIQVSRKNKNVQENSKSNPLMAGFPSYTLNKFIDILVKHNKTIVLVEQTTPPPNPMRGVTRIISPATYDESFHQDKNTNYILHLFLQPFKHQYLHIESLAIGISAIDCSTGKTFVDEFIQYTDFTILLQQIQNVGININPKEVIISSQDQISSAYEDCIIKSFPNSKVYNNIRRINSDFSNISFQRNILENTFKNNSQLTIFEFLDIERMITGNLSFCYLINFIHKHNPQESLKIFKPERLFKANILKIESNASDQLNITKGNITILDIMNNTRTAIGKRYFRSRILNPSSDSTIIHNSYKVIEQYNTILNISVIEDELNKIKDIEKIIHKPSQKFKPYDILNIYKSLQSITKINSILVDTGIYSKYFSEQNVISFHLENIFNFDENNNDFNAINIHTFLNINDEIKKLEKEKNHNISIFESFLKMLNSLMNSNDHFKLEHNERDGYFITTSCKRLEIFKKKHQDILKDCMFSHNKTVSKIYIKDEKKTNDIILKTQIKIDKDLKNEFTKTIDYIQNSFVKEFTDIIHAIEEIDFYTTCVSNNKVFCLCKPIVNASNLEDAGSVQAKALRHPIIEHINKEIRYIPNDITLDSQGMLLYGINASGKSSLMKSLGIAIILAQAGCYVSANEFLFTPYNKLFTRITGNDDIYKSQSTFVLEMSELRTIIQNADHKTLVVGDELCNGTETISAVSIVSASIDILSTKRSSFIFATHLHELNKFVQNTNICHLSVEYDNINNSIIYDRILKPGMGMTLYGLEVCKSLNMSEDFMNLAFNIRNTMTNYNKTTKKSQYNKNVFLQKCAICDESATDTHHIKEKHLANSEGIVENFHINEEFNLISLCGSCHYAVHHKNLRIYGYQMTSQGKRLIMNGLKMKIFSIIPTKTSL